MTSSGHQTPRTTVIVPTLGRSRWLIEGLEALGQAAGDDLEIVLVAQGKIDGEILDRASRLTRCILRLPNNVGFAAANNRALPEARGELVATVNDDVLVDASWYEALIRVLDAEPDVAAVQGVNLKLDEPRLADGCGILWNRSWQAVQIAHGEPAPRASQGAVEVFGVSATAAIYRRQRLEEIAVSLSTKSRSTQAIFDPRLVSYYEDVDLACRLRAAGHRAFLVPAARALHAGSASGRQLSLGGAHLIYGNRHLVLARLLGRAYRSELPRIGGRDVLDLGQALRRGRLRRATGIVAGWVRAVRHLRHYLHSGEPVVPIIELQRTSGRDS